MFENSLLPRTLETLQAGLGDNVCYVVSGSLGDVIFQFSILREAPPVKLLLFENHHALARRFGFTSDQVHIVLPESSRSVVHQAVIYGGTELKKKGRLFPLLPTLIPHLADLIYLGELNYVSLIRYLVGSNNKKPLSEFPKSSLGSVLKSKLVLICPHSNTIGNKTLDLALWLALVTELTLSGYRCVINTQGIPQLLDYKKFSTFETVSLMPEDVLSIASKYSAVNGAFTGLNAALAMHTKNLQIFSVIHLHSILTNEAGRYVLDCENRSVSFEKCLSLCGSYPRSFLSPHYHEVEYSGSEELVSKLLHLLR
jgi:hypothetical protein